MADDSRVCSSRVERVVVALTFTLVAAAALTACSDGPAVVSTTAPTASASTTTSPHGMAERPGATSGELSQEDLPAPSGLGKNWEYRVDPGDPEEGYQGSGAPATERDPRSVMDAITPLGCRPGELPTPQRALEVTYQRGTDRHGVPGVALVLQFTSADEAQRFFAVHTQVLTTCSSSNRVDLDVLALTADTVVSARTEELGHTPTWVEGARLAGDEVRLIAVADDGASGVRSVSSALAAMSG